MPLVNSFDGYSPWADITETILQLDRKACLLVVILHRNIERGMIKKLNLL